MFQLALLWVGSVGLKIQRINHFFIKCTLKEFKGFNFPNRDG